jgi:sn-glycerol 3-phosphate transport system ATP-binding protein
MVFQSYALFPHLTVEENIVFGLKVRRLPPPERKLRLERVAELVGLTERLDHKPQQLSGGQRQRVALARAIVSQNPICLMDEPLSNLDAQLRQEMRVEIRALQRRLAMTVVYVTHDQVEAMSMADHVVLLREGRIEQEGTPAELYSRPATTFAARFIGTPAMNLVALEDGMIRGSGEKVLDGGRRGRLTLGIRPEHIRITNDGIAAIVTSAEYHGADTVVTARVGEESLLVRAPGQVALAPGSQVKLGWVPDAIHVFDAETGTRAAAQ